MRCKKINKICYNLNTKFRVVMKIVPLQKKISNELSKEVHLKNFQDFEIADQQQTLLARHNSTCLP